MFGFFSSAKKTPTDAEISAEFDRIDMESNTELNKNSFGSALVKAGEAAAKKRAYLNQHGVTDAKYESKIAERVASLSKSVEDKQAEVRLAIGGAAKKPAAKKPAAKKPAAKKPAAKKPAAKKPVASKK